MSKELSYKHQILLKGGSFDESNDTVENWLTFLTDTTNLQPGLPNLTIAVGEWNIFYIHVVFDKAKPSLHALRLELNSFDESEVPIFRDPNPADTAPAHALTGLPNPYHLHQWVFQLFEQRELVTLEVPFLTPELPDLFDKLPKLKYVSVKKSTLVRLPPGFYKLPALHELNITGSGLPELPAELATLSSLQRLSFDQPFKPEVLGSLINLTDVQCYCTDLTVPIEFRKLVNLKSLHLASIISAPNDLLDFPSLKFLNLQVSKFTKFRFDTGNAPVLTELVTNSLEVFSTALGVFKNLRKISASGKIYPADLEPFKKSFSQLHKLTSLSLNRLEYYNPEKGLYSVRYRDLDFFETLLNLEYLNLNENGLGRMPLLNNLQNLKELHLRNNQISDFRELPPNLEYLDLSKNDFYSIQADLSYLKNVKTLLLNNNKLNAFSISLPSLEHLSLAENRLVEIPSGLINLPNLKTIYLNNNLLNSVPQLPVNLELVDLSRNAITQLPLGLGKLKKLKSLKLNKNPIVDLPELPVMPAIENLEIADTKLPESEYVAMPTEEIMEKLKAIFPNAQHNLFGFS
jgi:Leucine-rich repeat (LRR) protein